MTEDIRCEDLAECWSRSLILAVCQTLLLRQSADLRVLVCRPCARLQDVGEQRPGSSRPVCAGPAANASVPHDSIKLLPTLEQLLRKRLHRHQLCKIHQNSFDFHTLLQQQADPHRLAIGLPKRLLNVRIQPYARVLALFRIASGVEDVQGLGLRAGEEELVDETAAGVEA